MNVTHVQEDIITFCGGESGRRITYEKIGGAWYVATQELPPWIERKPVPEEEMQIIIKFILQFFEGKRTKLPRVNCYDL